MNKKQKHEVIDMKQNIKDIELTLLEAERIMTIIKKHRQRKSLIITLISIFLSILSYHFFLVGVATSSNIHILQGSMCLLAVMLLLYRGSVLNL